MFMSLKDAVTGEDGIASVVKEMSREIGGIIFSGNREVLVINSDILKVSVHLSYSVSCSLSHCLSNSSPLVSTPNRGEEV